MANNPPQLNPSKPPQPYSTLWPAFQAGGSGGVNIDDLILERFPPRMEPVGLYGDPNGINMPTLHGGQGGLAGSMNLSNVPKNGGICGKASFPRSLFDASDQLETLEHGCDGAPSFGSFEGGNAASDNSYPMSLARQNYRDVLGSFGFTISQDDNLDQCLVFRVKHTTITIRHTFFGSFISPAIVEGNVRLPCNVGSFNFGGIKLKDMGPNEVASASRTATVKTQFENGQMNTTVAGDTGWKPGNGNHPGPDFDQEVDINPFSDKYEDAVPMTLQELGSLDIDTVREVLDQLKEACNQSPSDPVTTVHNDPIYGPYAVMEGTTTTMEMVSIKLHASLPCETCSNEAATVAYGGTSPRAKGLWDYLNLQGSRWHPMTGLSYSYGYNGVSKDEFGSPSLFGTMSKALGLTLGQLLGGMADVEVPNALDFLEQGIQNAVNSGEARTRIGDFAWGALIGPIAGTGLGDACTELLGSLGRAKGVDTVGDLLQNILEIKANISNGIADGVLAGFGLSDQQIAALQKEGYSMENLMNASPFPTKGLCEVVDALQKLLDVDPSTFGDKVKERITKYFSDDKFGTQTLEDLIFNKPEIERAAQDQNQGKEFPPTLPNGGGNYLLGISNSLNTP